MAIVSADKIFIDPKEEITFILESIKDAEKEKVILVVPQSSVLFTSNISVNILFESLLNTKKVVVLVTEDEFGSHIAQKAGFIVKNKVSEVDSQAWANAQTQKENAIKLSDGNKAENLENVVGEAKYDEEINEDKVSFEAEIEKDYLTSSDQSLEKSSSEADVLEEALEKYKKPRQEAKIVEVDGLQIMAGGDIRNNHPNNLKDVKIEDEELLNDDMSKDANVRKPVNVSDALTFTGRDFTKSVKPKKSFLNKLNIGFKKRKTLSDIDNSALEESHPGRKKRRRLMLLLLIGGLILLFGGSYVLANSMSSVDIELQLKKKEVSFSEKIIADTSIEEIDVENYTIPSLLVKEEGMSISRTGEANGKGKTGTKAKGFVNIYNTTSSTISIKSGTKITSVATGLKYQITKDVTVDATQTAVLQEASEAGIADDVPIEAVDFGAEYNIDDSVSNTIFEIEGFTGVDSIYAKRFNAFEGGEAREFTSVSKENIDNLKKQIVPELEKQGKTKIEAFLPAGYTIIEETIEFKEEEVTAFPAEGEEAKDKNFNLTVEGSISAIAIREDDLRELVETFLSSTNAEGEEGILLEGISEFLYKDVVRNDEKASFTLSLEGEATVVISESAVKQGIRGKGLDEAKEYLEKLEQVENAKIRFNPNFLPSSLQRIPTEDAKIKLVTK